MSRKEVWEHDIADARNRWKSTKEINDYEVYAMACAAYLCSDIFESNGEHWFCGDEKTRQYAISSLIIFSFTLSDDDENPANVRYRNYENRFSAMLSRCRDCAIAYQCCDKDLIKELADDVGIQETRVSSFLQELHRKDRIRLTAELHSNKNIVPNLTEALWSFACMTSQTFLNQVLIEPNLLNEHSVSFNEVGACPGFVLLSFSPKTQVRRMALNQISKPSNLPVYASMWEAQPLKFKKMLSTGIKRNFKAEHQADFAWFTASFIINLFTKHPKALKDIIGECVSNLQISGLGIPKFGAHALLLKIMLANSNNNKEFLSKSSLEHVLDYVTKFKHLKHGAIDQQAPAAAHDSKSYKNLSASLVSEWMKLYLGFDPDSQIFAKRLEFLLQLSEDAYETNAEYEYASRIAVKCAAVCCTQKTVELVLGSYSSRSARVFAEIRTEWMVRLWKYQLKSDLQWLPFWNELLDNPQFIAKSISSKRYNGSLVGIFQGASNVALKFQLPQKSQRSQQHPVPGVQDKYEETQCETFMKSLLESLTDTADSDQLLPILLDKNVLRSVLLLSVSGNRGLSLAAEEFMKQAADVDSRESLVHFLVKEHTGLTLTAVNSLLADAAPASATWLATMAGLLRLALTVLDQVYSTHDGIDTTANIPILKLLHQFWIHSWSVVANVIKSIRTWAKDYAVMHVKSVLTVVLEFSQGLLSKFRLLDADLGPGLASGQNWGANLAEPAISCINSMGDMLQLAIPELLAMAVSIIVEILGLINSFNVTIPDTLLSLLEGLATKRLNSRLSKDQLRDLLSATNLSEEEITDLIEHKRNNTSSHTDITSSHRLSSSSSSRYSSQQQQMSIGDFFKSSGGQKPSIPKQTIVNNQILPQSRYQSTGLSLIKAQLSKNQHDTIKGRINPNVGVIHPERPPGFNVPKPQKRFDSSSSDDDDDDLEDQESALHALGAKQKRDAAADKLRQAYEQSKTRPGIPQFPVDSSGMHQQRQLQAEKERAAKAMKLRLNAQPTELHRAILSWDYFATQPPFKAISSIPDTFRDVKQYQDILTPLLYLEAWEQIQNIKEELKKTKPKPFLVVFGKRVKVDGFTDVYVSVLKESFAASGLGEGNLLFLTYDKAQPGKLLTPSESLPHCFARIKEGSIKNFGNAAKGQYVDFQIRINDQIKFLGSLSNGTTVCGLTLGNMRTVEREFTALIALPYYDLLEPILKAQPAISHAQPNQVLRLQQNLSLNQSQALAVSRALASEGFHLIQGPPGTGKTKTILGIIGSFFTMNALVSQTTGQATSSKKILVCAPSNAAVDEIVLRLKQGVTDSAGMHKELNLLRLGRLEMISEQVRDVTLDELVSKELKGSAEPVDEQLRRDHTALVNERNKIREKLKTDDAGDNSLTAEEVKELSDKLKDLAREIREKNYALDMQRDRLEQARKARDLQFRQQQNDILQKAQVVCTTLSASAHPLLASLGVTFDTVIIDEAAQSIELSVLIPLKYGCQNCIMVGDPNQLPPTVISQEASQLKYEQSLFVRMFNQYKGVPDAVSMLDTQFRMHPEIALFPSIEFYDGKLKNGNGLEGQLTRPWHKAHDALGPYTFFEVHGKHERGDSTSLKNVAEASAALSLVKFIRKHFGDVGSIGVISPYREQVKLMRQMFIQSQGADITSVVDFNSIDGFQGQEKDIIILSCVRASDAKTNYVGFLGDVRRMNVALTRAKTSLWILGHPESLRVNRKWLDLLNDAKSRGRLVNAQSTGIVDSIIKFRSVKSVTETIERGASHEPIKRKLEYDESESSIASKRFPTETEISSRTKDSSTLPNLSGNTANDAPPSKVLPYDGDSQMNSQINVPPIRRDMRKKGNPHNSVFIQPRKKRSDMRVRKPS